MLARKKYLSVSGSVLCQNKEQPVSHRVRNNIHSLVVREQRCVQESLCAPG